MQIKHERCSMQNTHPRHTPPTPHTPPHPYMCTHTQVTYGLYILSGDMILSVGCECFVPAGVFVDVVQMNIMSSKSGFVQSDHRLSFCLLLGNISQLGEHTEMCQRTQTPFVILVCTREEDVSPCGFRLLPFLLSTGFHPGWSSVAGMNLTSKGNKLESCLFSQWSN